MDAINNFLSLEALGTFAGASGVVLLISNTYRVFFKKNSPWPCFIIAMGISVACSAAAHKLSWDPLQLLLVFINGCLLFYNSAGIQAWTANVTTPAPVGGNKPNSKTPVKFFSRWL
jgi:hypothetical protein